MVTVSVISVLEGASLHLPFETLAVPLQKSAGSIESLSRKTVMQPNETVLKVFLKKLESTLVIGSELANTYDAPEERLNLYLKDLRDLARKKEAIDILYRQALSAAIRESDKKAFEELISVPLEPLHHPRTLDFVLPKIIHNAIVH
jgi:hypothetical protein